MKILHDSPIRKNSLHGGNRRGWQISHLLADAALPVHTITADRSRQRRRTDPLRALWFFVTHRQSSAHRLTHHGARIRQFRQALHEHPDARLLIWERTTSHITLEKARAASLAIIAMPHNIEALVEKTRLTFAGKGLYTRLQREMEKLSSADDVVCISRNDQWFLQQFGIDASYLPYYPISSIEAQLLRVREQRLTSEKTSYLMIGSATWRPTHEGMVHALRWLLPICDRHGVRIEIAGYGTEVLEPFARHDNVTIHGEVRDDELERMQARCIGAIVDQRRGSGALTRIPELLVAGVPVISTPVAARDMLEQPGIHLYESQRELCERLLEVHPVPPKPRRPTREEQCFIQLVRDRSDAGEHA